MQTWREELGNPSGHDLDLAATFRVSWAQVTDETARRLFLLTGHCAANEPIPCQLLLQAANRWLDAEALPAHAACVDACAEAFANLTGLALLKEAPPPGEWDPADAVGGVFIIHPLLAEYARTSEAAPYVFAVLACTLITLSYRAHQTGLPTRFVPLGAHVARAAPVAENDKLSIAATLWNILGSRQHDVADYVGARKSYERALAIDEAAYGLHHPDVARDANNLGGVLRALGDLPGARASYGRALAIDEATYGPNHPDVAMRINNVARVLHDLGDLAGARKSYERALAILEPVLGPHHQNVATLVNNREGVLRAQGDLAGARESYKRALAIDEAVLGPDHPNVARDVNNLGRVLFDVGDLTGARDSFKRALAIDEAAYGPDHPNVALRANNLGGVLRAQGDLAGARAAFERALAIWEATLPPDHPDIQTARGNLQSLTQT